MKKTKRSLFLLLLLSMASTPAAGAETVWWMLENLEGVRFTPKKALRHDPPRGLTQPMWHVGLSGKTHSLRHRVVLKDRKTAIRDMRDALIVPADTKIDFEVPACEGPRLVATVLLVGRGKETALVLSDADGKELWRRAVAAERRAPATWPEDLVAPVPRGTRKLRLAVTGGSGKTDLILANPRLECRSARRKIPRYNVIYIVVDALRSDVVGVHNKAFPSVSPQTDALEKSGATFPRGFANGNTTLLSMNTMLFGAHPRALGFLVTFWNRKDLRPKFYRRPPPFITRLLHHAGYLTYGATHNHLYFPGYKWGVDPGFDILQDCGKGTDDAPILTQRAIEFMEKHRDRPFLLQLNLLAPHQPYKPPKEVLEAVRAKLKGHEHQPVDTYLGEVAWADQHVGILVKALDRLGLRDRTLIILTGDHGEIMDPRHACTISGKGSGCYHLHGLTLFDEELNVPMIFSLPGVIKAGQVRKEIAQHVDIAPSILALLGLPIPKEMTGRSLLPALKGAKETMPDVPVFAERWVTRALRVGRYKLIQHTRRDEVCPRSAKEVCKVGSSWHELYDIEADPKEHNEISRQKPDVAKDMLKKIQEWRMRLYELSGGEGPNP